MWSRKFLGGRWKGVWGGAEADSGLVWGQSQKDILRQEWGAFPASLQPGSPGRGAGWEGAGTTESRCSLPALGFRLWAVPGWGRAEGMGDCRSYTHTHAHTHAHTHTRATCALCLSNAPGVSGLCCPHCGGSEALVSGPLPR